MAQNEEINNGQGKFGQQIIENRERSDGGSTQPVANEVAGNTVTGTANASATASATPEEVPAWAATNEQGQGRLEQMALQMAGENPTLTPEQKEAEQKKRDRNMRWAKLNDAIAAMSNLYFTSKYAPNAFDPNNLATKKLRERYDKIDADRDKDRQAWYNIVMPAIKGDTENQRAYYQLQQQAAEKEKDRAHDLTKLEKTQTFTAGENKLNRDAAKELQQMKQIFEAEQNDLNRKNALKTAGIAHGGSGKKGEFRVFTKPDENGNYDTLWFTNKEAAEWFARQEGTYDEFVTQNEDTTTKQDNQGATTETTVTTKNKMGGYSKKPNTVNYNPNNGANQ